MSCGDEKIHVKKMYHMLDRKRKEIEKKDPIYLYQKDFSKGTYIINKPGYYVLKENIVFNPNPDNDYLPNDSKYETLGYSLGFFAVISIAAKDVYLDLNEYCISASPEFTLQQRFFSIIELANAPFIVNEGPSNFTTSESFKAAENTIIRNGTLGLSSHHGVHGSMAKNILLENLKIKDFEFVGVALNGGNCFALKDIEIGPNRQDIPVLATYSAARFAKMFAKKVLSKITSTEMKNEIEVKLNELENEMNETFSEAMSGTKISSDLFRNNSKLADGNVYGVVIKNRGVAVNDFVQSSIIKTNNVFLDNVNIKDLKCRVDEIIALSTKGGKGATVDSAGAVLQIDKITYEGKYSGTPLSDLQLYLAKIGHELKTPFGKNNISLDILTWANNGDDISTLLRKGHKYKCGGDSMFHFNKGSIGYRFDAINNLVLKKSRLDGLTNTGCLGNDQIIGNYEKSHDMANRKGYFGANSTGVNISYCSSVKIKKCGFSDIFAKDGDAMGINVIFKSDVTIEKCEINDIKAGTLVGGKWKGKDYYGDSVKYKDIKMPNQNPRSIGIRIEKDSLVDLDDVKIWDLKSPAKPIKILRE